MTPPNINGAFIAEESYPIRTVSKITGVNSVTLRAWERRYGLITPQRTPTGHRLYSKDDIQMIEQAKQLLAAGSSISQISRQLKSTRSFESLLVEQPATIWQEYQERMLEAITEFDEEKLDNVYQEALSFHAVYTVTNELVIPLLKKLGARWEEISEGSIAEEHFFSVYLRNKIGAQYHHKRGRNNGPLIVAACLPGESHEFALLLFGLIAHENNYRIIMLGADMPLEEIPLVMKRTQADALVLSCHENCDLDQASLGSLHSLQGKPIFVGGNLTEHQQAMFSPYQANFLDENYQTTIDIINRKLGTDHTRP